MINSKPKIIETEENKNLKILKMNGKTKYLDLQIDEDVMKLQRQIQCVIIKEKDDARDIYQECIDNDCTIKYMWTDYNYMDLQMQSGLLGQDDQIRDLNAVIASVEKDR